MDFKVMTGETSVLSIKNMSSFYFLNGYSLVLHRKGYWYSEEVKEGYEDGCTTNMLKKISYI